MRTLRRPSWPAPLRDRGVRVRVDDREDVREGVKFHEWERKGVPMRVDVGPRDVAAGTAMVTRRDSDERLTLPFGQLADRVVEILAEQQAGLLAEALAFREANTFDAESLADARAILGGDGGFVRAGWCGDAACEDRMKAETRATIRCLPLDDPRPARHCVACGRPAEATAIWGHAY